MPWQHNPVPIGFAIFDTPLLNRYKRNGPDILSHVHPHDLYDQFDAAWDKDIAEGYESICEADTLEELAEKAGIDVDGFMAQIEEYNEMCDNGYDEVFEKNRMYMQPIRKGKFYCCRQNVGAYGSLGGILINHRTEVLDTDSRSSPDCTRSVWMPVISTATVIRSSCPAIRWAFV